MSQLRLCLLFLAVMPVWVSAQTFTLAGRITNSRLEPLPFASIQVKELQRGTLSKEDGSYSIALESGEYDIGFSMTGYKPQLIHMVIGRNETQNIILEDDASASMENLTVKGRSRDRAEELVRNVIRHKEALQAASGAYSCTLYIKALQQDSIGRKMKILPKDSARFEFNGLSMAEISLRLDHASDKKIKEEREGVRKSGNTQNLFYLSTTEGEFDFYNNLVRVPGLSPMTFLSPVSYSGLMAYRFKTLRIVQQNGHKLYTIAVKPRQISNATVEGELTITDSSWALVHLRFSFPRYHLPEYDAFQVEQDFSPVQEKAWMITRQQFNYIARGGKHKVSGQTTVIYSDYVLNKDFDRHYFGTEVSAAAQAAYERDSSFWDQARTEPLTAKELRFIRYKDSIYRVTHAKAYLDSVDRVINKITWKKLGFLGQVLYNRQKQRTWSLPPLISLYQPVQFGGTRISPFLFYSRIYPSRKSLLAYANVSYGLRNKDVNGSLSLTRMYNPFNRAFYSISLSRDFRYIFEGDAWINMIKRNNYYLNNGIGIGHGRELVNGLFVYANADFALRRSLSGYKTNSKVDSLFGSVLTDNHAVYFEPYNALYGKVRLQYTPRQRYIREPKEKIILGSAWPTFYTTWRKGIAGPLASRVDFDFLEFGIEQQVNMGLLGIMHYSIRSGSFISRKDLRLVDYQFQRRGDPVLFMNPDGAFQALDSTFPLFKRYYQGHLVHEFNGALINKIPILKKLQLREIAGSGFLIAPERNLRYGELFTGVERVFRSPFNSLSKFKLGVYIVGSAANNNTNHVMFKVGIATWDIRNNKWL